MIVVPTYRVVYRGSPAKWRWSEIGSHLERRQAEAGAVSAAGEARKRAACEKNFETETDKHVLLDALLGFIRRNAGSTAHIEAIQEPEWLRQVSLEKLRFLIDKHGELARLQEANEGLHERWQAHVVKKK